jgi:hypothetical protein
MTIGLIFSVLALAAFVAVGILTTSRTEKVLAAGFALLTLAHLIR